MRENEKHDAILELFHCLAEQRASLSLHIEIDVAAVRLLRGCRRERISDWAISRHHPKPVGF